MHLKYQYVRGAGGGYTRYSFLCYGMAVRRSRMTVDPRQVPCTMPGRMESTAGGRVKLRTTAHGRKYNIRLVSDVST